jgi:hypothetical protein
VAQQIGKVGKGTDTTNSGAITTLWTGGGNSTAGSTILAILVGNQNNAGLSPTTPTGFTLRASNVSASGEVYVYERVNAPATANVSISFTTTSGTTNFDIIELQGTGFFDSISSFSTGSTGTTLTTGSLTTVAANTIILGLFASRGNVTLSTPGAGFTQTQACNGPNTDGISRCVSYETYEVVTSTQSSITTTCAASANNFWTAALIAYAQAVPAVTPAARKRKRPFKRMVRRASERSMIAGIGALINLFPFARRRRRIRLLRRLRRRPRGFYGDITPIAPAGRCFTITVSERLGATLALSEEMAAAATEIERLSASGTASERLSAAGLVQARLGCSVTIVCCR